LLHSKVRNKLSPNPFSLISILNFTRFHGQIHPQKNSHAHASQPATTHFHPHHHNDEGYVEFGLCFAVGSARWISQYGSVEHQNVWKVRDIIWDEGFVEQFGSRGHDHSVDEGFGLGNWDRDVTGWGRP
jgi:hypothetical protein